MFDPLPSLQCLECTVPRFVYRRPCYARALRFRSLIVLAKDVSISSRPALLCHLDFCSGDSWWS